MSHPPATNREYAYFCASGLFDPEEITELIGLEPTEFWSAGDQFVRRGHHRTRRGSHWKLDSKLPDTEPLSDHIEAILNRVSPHRIGLLKASTKAKLQIVCVGYYYQSFSWELKLDSQRLATDLNITFCFDIYNFEDPHEEMVEMREQLNVRKALPED